MRMTITSWGQSGGLNELMLCKHIVSPKKIEAIMMTLLWPLKSESLVLSFHHILFVCVSRMHPASTSAGLWHRQGKAEDK